MRDIHIAANEHIDGIQRELEFLSRNAVQPDADVHVDAEPNLNPHVDADHHPNVDAGAHANFDPNVGARAHANFDPHVGAGTHAHLDSNAHADP